MTPLDLLNEFRDQSGDNAVPPMWSDAEIYRYIDRAQTTFARETDGIRDSVSSICHITFTPTDLYIPYSPKILKIFSARDDVRGCEYTILNHTDPRVRGTMRVSSIRYLVVGESENMLRAHDWPYADTAVTLTVGRLPLTSIAGSGDVFEIRDEYIPYLLDGMFELAYLKDDPDTYNKVRSESASARFLARCNKVKLELERRNYKPGLIAYGGI